MNTGENGIFQKVTNLTESVILLDKDTENTHKTTAKTLQRVCGVIAGVGFRGMRKARKVVENAFPHASAKCSKNRDRLAI